MNETIKKRRGRPPKKVNLIEGDLLVSNVVEEPLTPVTSNENSLLDNSIQNESDISTDASTVCDNNQDNTVLVEDTGIVNENISHEYDDCCSTIEDFIHCKQTFIYDGITWTPHKYNIGDVVWVPQDEVVNVSDAFSSINAILISVPKKFTVASVVYTNKVSYTFKESSKIIASENFVCATEEQCKLLCKELNN